MLSVIVVVILFVISNSNAQTKTYFAWSGKSEINILKSCPSELEKDVDNGNLNDVTKKYNIEFARHHIVSKDVLIEFWAACAKNGGLKLLVPLLNQVMKAYGKTDYRDPKNR